MFLKCMLLSLLLLPLSCSKPPNPVSEDYSEINVFKEPVQINLDGKDTVHKKIKQGEFTMVLNAKYTVAAMVPRKKFYHGWLSGVAPVDLVLVWGNLAGPEYDKYMAYSQSGRWYYYRYKAGSPFDGEFVIQHSANNHIIPDNDNIFRAIKAIGSKGNAVLEGYLVNINGFYEGRSFYWNSSMTRGDTADGSCEVFYVTKVKVNNKVYE
jgi:hypothetical protein